jgi:hypothetical protein
MRALFEQRLMPLASGVDAAFVALNANLFVTMQEKSA